MIKVISYHGKSARPIERKFIDCAYAYKFLFKHYNRSDYNHCMINDRLCFTLDQADYMLQDAKRKGLTK